MAHYAFLDENNVVTEVITGRNEDEIVDGISDWEKHYGNFRGQRCLRTSYNNKIRGRFAQIGYTYNEEADVFIAPQPYPSWILDENHEWKPPVSLPADAYSLDNVNGVMYIWDETTEGWIDSGANNIV